MTTGSPIDSIIRQLTISPVIAPAAVPDSQANLAPTPQVLMTPGSEQFSFQYADNHGNGNPQYQGYIGAGAGAGSQGSNRTDDDFISIMIEKPTNKTYTIAYNIPFPVTVTGSVSTFGTGPGVATMPGAGVYATGSDINIIISGTSGATANFRATVHTKIQQSG